MKKLFLIALTALSFAQNVKADCLSLYKNQVEELDRLSHVYGEPAVYMSATGILFQGIGASINVEKKPHLANSAGGAMAFGGALTSTGTLGLIDTGTFMYQANELRVLQNLFLEADLGTGLTIVKLADDINSISNFAEITGSFQVENIVDAIREINKNESNCTNGKNLANYKQIIEQVIIKLEEKNNNP